MPNVRFIDVTVASLKTRKYWDSTFPAIGLRVGKRARTFIVNHNRTRKKIGRYPSIKLADARQQERKTVWKKNPAPG